MTNFKLFLISKVFTVASQASSMIIFSENESTSKCHHSQDSGYSYCYKILQSKGLKLEFFLSISYPPTPTTIYLSMVIVLIHLLRILSPHFLPKHSDFPAALSCILKSVFKKVEFVGALYFRKIPI